MQSLKGIGAVDIRRDLCYHGVVASVESLCKDTKVGPPQNEDVDADDEMAERELEFWVAEPLEYGDFVVVDGQNAHGDQDGKQEVGVERHCGEIDWAARCRSWRRRSV